MRSALSLMMTSRGSLIFLLRKAQKFLLVSKHRIMASFRASLRRAFVMAPVPAPYSAMYLAFLKLMFPSMPLFRYFELGVMLPISLGFLMKFPRNTIRSLSREFFSMG